MGKVTKKKRPCFNRPQHQPQSTGNPLKRRRIEYVSNSNNTNNAYIITHDNVPALIPPKASNDGLSAYPIYGETEEHRLENALIAKIDGFINSIKRNDGKCKMFEAAKQR